MFSPFFLVHHPFHGERMVQLKSLSTSQDHVLVQGLSDSQQLRLRMYELCKYDTLRILVHF